MLESRSTQALPGFSDVRFDIAALNRSKRYRLFLKVLEEALNCPPVV
jgi:hypothetical protein